MFGSTSAFPKSLRDEFDHDGFVVLREFFSPTEVAHIQAEVSRYIDHTVPGLPPGEVMYEDKNRRETLKQLPNTMTVFAKC